MLEQSIGELPPAAEVLSIRINTTNKTALLLALTAFLKLSPAAPTQAGCSGAPGAVPSSLWCLPHARAPWKLWAPSESASHPPKTSYWECSRWATRSVPGPNACKHYKIGGGRSEGTGNVSSDTIFAPPQCPLGIPQFHINSFSAWHRGNLLHTLKACQVVLAEQFCYQTWC